MRVSGANRAGADPAAGEHPLAIISTRLAGATPPHRAASTTSASPGEAPGNRVAATGSCVERSLAVTAVPDATGDKAS